MKRLLTLLAVVGALLVPAVPAHANVVTATVDLVAWGHPRPGSQTTFAAVCRGTFQGSVQVAFTEVTCRAQSLSGDGFEWVQSTPMSPVSVVAIYGSAPIPFEVCASAKTVYDGGPSVTDGPHCVKVQPQCFPGAYLPDRSYFCSPPVLPGERTS